MTGPLTSGPPPPEEPPERGPTLVSDRKRRPGRVVLWVAVAVGTAFAGLAVVMAVSLGDEPGYRGTALLGRPAPELTLTTFEGDPFEVAPRDGRVVVVNFWNSWCIPCREEEPALQDFYSAHAGDPDFAMVGIVRDDNRRDAERWVADHGTPWPVAMDPGARAAVDFGTTGQPETYAISADGVLVARHLGRATVADLERLLAAARGEAIE